MLRETDLFGKTTDKVQKAMRKLRFLQPPEGYYVAFSGGKDSMVILDLVKRAGVKYDAHHNLTTVEPPELIYFIRKNYAVIPKARKEQKYQGTGAYGAEVIKWGNSAGKRESAERDFLSPSAKKTGSMEYAGACSIAEKLVMRQI